MTHLGSHLETQTAKHRARVERRRLLGLPRCDVPPCRTDFLIFLLLACAVGLLSPVRQSFGQGIKPRYWVWSPEGNPATEAPEETRYFRGEFSWSVQGHAQFVVACDGPFVLWCDGKELGRSEGGLEVVHIKKSAFMENSDHVVAVQAANDGGPAGLLVWGTITGSGTTLEVATDKTWKVSTRPEEGWNKHHFDDSNWQAVKVLGGEGLIDPWKDIRLTQSANARFQVPKGFRVETVADPDLSGSVVCMTLDSRSRPIISRERGPIFRLLDEDGDGQCEKTVQITDRVQNCQGLCEVRPGLLYAIGEGPDGVALYRLEEPDGDEQAEDIETVLRFKLPTMEEHGPHGVVYGPDGMLYLALGNTARIADSKPNEASPVRLFYEGIYGGSLPAVGGAEIGPVLPAGTIVRVDPRTQSWSRIACGLRNEYDLAFDRHAEIFTYDSDADSEYDLPWYRPVRANHIVPGADYGWRAGSGKWPEYFADSLPALENVGHCSPTGLIVYRHHQFPETYHNNLFMCDWSRGQLLALRLRREGGSFTCDRRVFATGAPLNITDADVGIDGSLYFSTGGRGTIGGVYRIVSDEQPNMHRRQRIEKLTTLEDAIRMPQPQSAWARARLDNLRIRLGTDWTTGLIAVIGENSRPVADVLASLDLLAGFGPEPPEAALAGALTHNDAEVRGRAAAVLGAYQTASACQRLQELLTDSAPIVRRKVCEALVRCGGTCDPKFVIPLLGDSDRWVRHAARLLLERIPSDQWRESALGDRSPLVRTHALLALARLSDENQDLSDQLTAAEELFTGRLHPETALDLTRVVQLLLLKHKSDDDQAVANLISVMRPLYPNRDWRLDRELARVLAANADAEIIHRMIHEILASDSHEHQMHLAACLAGAQHGWTAEHFSAFFSWLENVAREPRGRQLRIGSTPRLAHRDFLISLGEIILDRVGEAERRTMLEEAGSHPFVSTVLISKLDDAALKDALPRIVGLLNTEDAREESLRAESMVDAIIQRVARLQSPETTAALSSLLQQDHPHRERILQAVAGYADRSRTELLLRALDSENTNTLLAAVRGLSAFGNLQGAENVRKALEAAGRLGPRGADQAIRLVEKWSGQDFEVSKLGWIDSLHQARAWYKRAYPEAPALAEFTPPKLTQWSYEDLSARLLDPRSLREASARRGRAVMEKARCLNCHRLGAAGEQVGPDLSTLRSRFDRRQMLESILFPSRVISDQYRTVTIVLDNGKVVSGLPVKQTDTEMTLVLSDTTKVTVRRSQIDEVSPSKVSVMPEGLLTPLTLEEIADLMAALR